TESIKKNQHFLYVLLDEAETLSFLMEEVVNPRGTLEGLKATPHKKND
ncbi:hypothetical protein H0185_10095, partial [Mesobacillus maritimus]|nr:hypothetical protein [Mesobacillus maritimus]